MKKILIIGLVLLLSGCSTKFVYKNVDWLVYWYVDDFVELTNQQEAIVDAKLETWLEWHKESELPQYIQHLSELSDDIRTQQLSLDKMDYHQQKAADHWMRLKAKIVPDLVAMSPMLSQEQVDSMFKEIDKMNEEEADERAEMLAKTPEKRKRESLKRNKRNVKRWLGQLDSAQEQLVEKTYGEYHSNGELWLQYRVRYQAQLRTLLNGTDKGEGFKTKLTKLLMEPEKYRGELLNQRNIDNSNKYKEFLLAADTLATEAQRKHLLDEIAEFADDLNDLVK
ncbi:MAG: DNA mismatch repair ATPase MutS [Glaciecola sp.]